jgi:hypothetical protein
MPLAASIPGRVCGVKIRVSDPTLVEDLAEMLRNAQYLVTREGRHTLDVELRQPLPEDAAQLEIDVYLRVWEATHEGARALRLTD